MTPFIYTLVAMTIGAGIGISLTLVAMVLLSATGALK